MEQFLHMLHHCGMPKDDVDFIHCSGGTMNELLLEARPRNVVFTGSQQVAEKLALDMNGKVCTETCTG